MPDARTTPADSLIALVAKGDRRAFDTLYESSSARLNALCLSILKDLPAFRKLGWKIVVVSLAANAGTFLGATMIAEFFH